MQNTTKQNHSGSVTSYNSRLGNEMGLFYNHTAPLNSTVIDPLRTANFKMSTFY